MLALSLVQVQIEILKTEQHVYSLRVQSAVKTEATSSLFTIMDVFYYYFMRFRDPNWQ